MLIIIFQRRVVPLSGVDAFFHRRARGVLGGKNGAASTSTLLGETTQRRSLINHG
jgi:hypothetical protein